MGLISNGTTIFDAGALDSGLAKGAMTFIKKLTASSSANLTFHNGTSGVVLDDTYKEYLFTFKNIHPQTNDKKFQFQANVSGASGFNENMTTTVFRGSHNEADNDTGVSYLAAFDQKNSDTVFQTISDVVGADANQCCDGTLSLYNPSNTTFVKHFISRLATYQGSNYAMDTFAAGYINTTSAIDEIQFKFESGNIDAGDICLYGIA